MNGMVTDISHLDFQKTYTYADYLRWRLDEYVELIKGKLFLMSPGPSSTHQRLSYRLGGAFYNYLQEKKCEAFAAPFDVRLFPSGSDQEITTVIQPDFCIVCDPSKIDPKGCLGAPDLVIEILSPSTFRKDLNEKYELYEEAGVLEYWVVRPEEKSIHVYLLKEGKFHQEGVFFEKDQLPVSIFPDLSIDLGKVF